MGHISGYLCMQNLFCIIAYDFPRLFGLYFFNYITEPDMGAWNHISIRESSTA